MEYNLSLGSIVTRLIVPSVLLIVLGLAGIFTWIFGITPIGMAAWSCANGSNTSGDIYTNMLGVLIALDANLPSTLIIFLKHRLPGFDRFSLMRRAEFGRLHCTIPDPV